MRSILVYVLAAVVFLGLLSFLGFFSKGARPRYVLLPEGQRSEDIQKVSEPKANEDCFNQRLQGPLTQEDSRLIEYIKSTSIIKEPSNGDYALKEPEVKDQSKGQAQVIRKIFKNKKNGFFIECGALDGETRSNTLTLERDFGWQGLLIEADPSNYKLVKAKNRKAWTVQACLAIHPYAHQVTFEQNFNIGKIVDGNGNGDEPKNLRLSKQHHVTVQCYPIYSLLKALGQTTIDYFSLDVEGNELDVLKTIPFDKVNIKTLSVEFKHTPGGAEGVRSFMASQGYSAVTTVIDAHHNQANDFIFVKDGLEGTEDVDLNL